MANGPPSRFEWDDLVRRLDRMDERGTSGAAGFLTRLERVERDQGNLAGRLDQEKRQRSDTRKWLIGIALSVAGLALAVASFVAVYIFHLH